MIIVGIDVTWKAWSRPSAKTNVPSTFCSCRNGATMAFFFIGIHRQGNHIVAAGKFGANAGQQRFRRPAIGAPRRPEVQDDNFPVRVGGLNVPLPSTLRKVNWSGSVTPWL